MKLRIRDNSLRLRLTRGELGAFAESGKIEAHTSFAPGATLTYAIAHTGDAARIAATFANGTILVVVPTAMARAWASSEDVGIEGAQGDLRVLIEKDFACLKPREGEDDDDAFPHPKAR